MSDKTYRKNLIEEANELGLEFPSNIKSTKLQGMVDAKQGESVGVKPPVEDKVEIPPVVEEVKPPITRTPAQHRHLKNRQAIAVKKKNAFKTKIVTITNRDTRDAEFTTTASLSFENNYFGLAKNVPLDVPVELEIALIKIAERTLMTIHKDEIKDGKRTGNKEAFTVKKYAVSYEEQVPE